MSDSEQPPLDRFGEPIKPIDPASLLYDPNDPLPYDGPEGDLDGPRSGSRTPLIVGGVLLFAAAAIGGPMLIGGSPGGEGDPAADTSGTGALSEPVAEAIRPMTEARVEGPVSEVVPIAVAVTRVGGAPMADTLVFFAIESGQGFVETSIVRADSLGIASTRFTLPDRPGSSVVRATLVGNDSTTTQITAVALTGGADAIVIARGNNQEALIGELLATRIHVRILDAEGNPVPNAEVRFRITEGEGITAPTQTRTDSIGEASALWRLGMIAGAQRLEAVSSDNLEVIVFSARALPRMTLDDPSDVSLETEEVTVREQTLAVGSSHVCVIRAGVVNCRGDGARGQTAAQGGTGYLYLTAGASHTCGLDAAGEATCWGGNENGQIGDGTRADRDRAVAVRSDLKFSTLAAGSKHTCGLAGGGVPLCWGNNLSGQLGDGTRNNETAPRTVGGGMIFRAIAAGWDHTCGLTASGNAFCWGFNSSGQLGDGSTLDRLEPTLVRGAVETLVAGSAHTCGISQGTVLCWGSNDFGQLGDGGAEGRSQPTEVSGLPGSPTHLAAGAVHSCALLADGQAFCWGQNRSGQLGDGSTTNRATPVPVSGSQRFTEIHAGGAQTCALTASGDEYCWGLNQSSQLGEGTRENRSVPTRVSR